MFDPARAPDQPFTIKCPKCGAAIQMPGRLASAAAAPPQFAQQSAPQPAPSAHLPPGAKRIDILLNSMVELKASDLHVSSECPPMIRKDGEMAPVPGWPVFSAADVKELIWAITPDRNKEQFEQCHDTDYAYEIEGLARFRVNIFMDRKGAGAVFRVIPSKIITAEDLNLSKEILGLCRLPKGLVLVTGPTGSGKSTTLCAMIDYINRMRRDHLITIEDPIEFVHENKGCLINQREVHEHTGSFKAALRAALREDPDIVYIGEMRDLETISIAIETAETGHLVFGTLHTSTAPSTIDRIIDQFPGDKQEQIRMMLSESLRGVICQMLCKKIGGGRVVAMEVLIVTHSVSNLIRERKTFQIQSILQTGRSLGMCTMNDSFLDLVRQRKVTPEEAYDKAIDKAGLAGMFEKNGVDTSWMK
jgi:twitching motility protein PilT